MINSMDNHHNKHFCIPENNFFKIALIGAGFTYINFIKRLKEKPVQVISITGFKNKFKVGFNWIMKYLSYEKANQ